MSGISCLRVTKGCGDHLVAGGAPAISAPAGAKLLAADSARLYLWNDDDRESCAR